MVNGSWLLQLLPSSVYHPLISLRENLTPERESSSPESHSELLIELVQSQGFPSPPWLGPCLCHLQPLPCFSLRLVVPWVLADPSVRFLPRRSAHLSQMCWVPQSRWAWPRGRSSASPRCSCCAKSCRFLRTSQSWPRSSPWFTSSTALDSFCPTWVKRQSPSSKPLGRIIMSLRPRSAYSVAAHYSKGDKSKHPFQICPVPSCPVFLGPYCLFLQTIKLRPLKVLFSASLRFPLLLNC